MTDTSNDLTLIKTIAQQLLDRIPESDSVQLCVDRSGYTTLKAFNVPDYHTGTEILRSFGIGDHTKQVFAESGSQEKAWSTVSGHIAPLVEITAFCKGLPPTCRLTTVKERIPKSSTVITDEFIEIERVKVKCGEGEEVGS